MFKVLDEACTPERGSKFSACIDLKASEDVVIGAGETKMIGLGVCIDIDELKKHPRFQSMVFSFDRPCDYEFNEISFSKFMDKHYLQLMLRSSLGKKGLILPNGVGIIDIDYRDEIKMIIHNPIANSKVVVSDSDVKYEHEIDIQHSDFMYSDHYTIKKGDRIAQITLLEHKAYLFGVDTEEERDGGFGSTDKKEYYNLKKEENVR